MLEKLSAFVGTYFEAKRTQITPDEVTRELSFTIWKTRDRIFEDVLNVRRQTGKELPREHFLIPHSLTITRFALRDLMHHNLVEWKRASKLSPQEEAWADISEGKFEESSYRQLNRPLSELDLSFYRLRRSGSPRRAEEPAVPESTALISR